MLIEPVVSGRTGGIENVDQRWVGIGGGVLGAGGIGVPEHTLEAGIEAAVSGKLRGERDGIAQIRGQEKNTIGAERIHRGGVKVQLVGAKAD